MASYKVIQDIEAEDHILGPFSFRQFVYLLIALFFLYLNFLAATKNAAFLLILFAPPTMFFGFLSFPFIKDQPTEIWALARINYLVKPRKKIWSQSNSKELVVITAPKKVDKQLTDGLDQSEVRSRLRILSDTLDSRGWAIKNVLNPSVDSDRLVSETFLPQIVPEFVENPNEDIMDEKNSQVASHLDDIIRQSTNQHRQKLIDLMNTSKEDPLSSQAEAEILNQIKKTQSDKKIALGNLSSVSKLAKAKASAVPEQKIEPINETVKEQSNTTILNLSKNNDLNLSTLSKVANKGSDNQEIVISLR